MIFFLHGRFIFDGISFITAAYKKGAYNEGEQNSDHGAKVIGFLI